MRSRATAFPSRPESKPPSPHKNAAGAVRAAGGTVLALAPQETRTAREPLRWKVDKAMMRRRETFSVVPDGLFGLLFPEETAAYFVLEVDRGTIPLIRTHVAGTPAW